jgi:hypothetical protein
MAGATPGGTMPPGPYDWLAVPGIGYRLAIPTPGIRFDVTRIRREHQETVGLLTVRVTFRGARTVADNILSSADFNCSGQRSRSERAKFLLERSRTDDIDWLGLLEDLCLRVLNAEDTGDPERPLQQVPMDDDGEAELQAAGLPVLRRHPTIWFGDGGCGKSYLALSAAVDLAQRGQSSTAIGGLPTNHRHRHRLVGPVQLDQLFYRQCDRPLIRDIGRIKEIVAARKSPTSSRLPRVRGRRRPGSRQRPPVISGLTGTRPDGGTLHQQAEQGDQKPFGSVLSSGARGLVSQTHRQNRPETD